VLNLNLTSRPSIRIIRQNEVSECGIACLVMISNYYGNHLDTQYFRSKNYSNIRGNSLGSLLDAANSVNLEGRALRLEPDQLGKIHLPAILHWNMHHYVVLESVQRGIYLIHDPAGISRKVRLSEISDSFTGVALELRPSINFLPSAPRPNLKISQLWGKLSGYGSAAVQTLLLSISLQIFVLIAPYYMQTAVDRVVPSRDDKLLLLLAGCFLAFTIFNSLTSVLRSLVLQSAGVNLGFGITSNIARKMLSLPISWFESRSIGDTLARLQSVKPIQQFLSETATSLLLDGSLAILLTVMMFIYSGTLAAVSVLAASLILFYKLIIYSKFKSAQERAIVASGAEQSVLIETLRGIVTLRLFRKETSRHSFWQSHLVDSINANVKLTRLGIWQSAYNSLILGIESVLAIWLAISLVLEDTFTVGMAYAFIAYKSQFLQRFGSFTEQIFSIKMLDVHLDRLSDVVFPESDPSTIAPSQPFRRLEGKIELRDIHFRYTEGDQYVLKGVNLTINPREHLAITGASGNGKTTLAKIMLGLVKPTSGNLLVDDVDIEEFGWHNLRDQSSVVMQNDVLFSGSLTENIALYDDDIDFDRVREAARSAAISDDIERMPMRYDTLVGDMGSALSGGQKQRILLARALYRNPRLILLDEGTSHLDVKREKEVNLSIENMGATRIIIAHRLETLKSAARVIRVTGGKVHDVTNEYRD
jgi:ATP-binding cassette subfamily B protein RaxB